jgi:hypothetical protein
MEEGLHNSLLSFPEHQTLHTFLLLLHRLLRSGHGERVRNVVDSEVIGSLREILDDLYVFGGIIGMLASKILAVIIHNEPTSYAALHENGLPQAFLSMVDTEIPPTAELIATFPNVFDAICINTQGKELFSEYTFEGFFRLFRSLPHCKAMTKSHCSADTGNGMDELLRHHPELKDIYFKEYVKMLKDVCEGIVMRLPPTGPKLPELKDMTSSSGDDEIKWLPCKLSPEIDLTKARREEEKNVPALLYARNVIWVWICLILLI